MWTVLFIVTELAAGLVQGITGFGSGIVQMMVYPPALADPCGGGPFGVRIAAAECEHVLDLQAGSAVEKGAAAHSALYGDLCRRHQLFNVCGPGVHEKGLRRLPDRAGGLLPVL